MGDGRGGGRRIPMSSLARLFEVSLAPTRGTASFILRVISPASLTLRGNAMPLTKPPRARPRLPFEEERLGVGEEKPE